jgi:hypothetical protein
MQTFKVRCAAHFPYSLPNAKGYVRLLLIVRLSYISPRRSVTRTTPLQMKSRVCLDGRARFPLNGSAACLRLLLKACSLTTSTCSAQLPPQNPTPRHWCCGRMAALGPRLCSDFSQNSGRWFSQATNSNPVYPCSLQTHTAGLVLQICSYLMRLRPSDSPTVTPLGLPGLALHVSLYLSPSLSLFGSRSLARTLARALSLCLAGCLSGTESLSLARSVARSLGRSVARSLARALSLSVCLPACLS